jgi:hypothetical protein
MSQAAALQTEVVYKVLDGTHGEAVVECVARLFAEREPMVLALGLSVDQMRPFVTLICERAVEEELSVVALDAATGQLLGGLLATDFGAEAQPEAADWQRACEPLLPVLELLGQLEQPFRAVEDLSPGKYLQVLMAASLSPSRGIYTRLREEAHRRAARRGFTHVVGEPSGVATQHVLVHKWQQQVVAEVCYRDFEFDGERVFQAISEPQSCVLTVGTLAP